MTPMKTRDGRFGYEATGDLGGTPLVFLHGIGGAARTWRGQLASFGDRYRAVAWDMPGYGGSAPLAKVSIATLADALQEVRLLQADKVSGGSKSSDKKSVLDPNCGRYGTFQSFTVLS